jgi:hypothetical protein
MRKQSPRPSVRKLSSFDIRPKKPPRHPSSAAAGKTLLERK